MDNTEAEWTTRKLNGQHGSRMDNTEDERANEVFAWQPGREGSLGENAPEMNRTLLTGYTPV